MHPAPFDGEELHGLPHRPKHPALLSMAFGCGVRTRPLILTSRGRSLCPSRGSIIKSRGVREETKTRETRIHRLCDTVLMVDNLLKRNKNAWADDYQELVWLQR